MKGMTLVGPIGTTICKGNWSVHIFYMVLRFLSGILCGIFFFFLRYSDMLRLCELDDVFDTIV
jgi:hypothetical protein